MKRPGDPGTPPSKEPQAREFSGRWIVLIILIASALLGLYILAVNFGPWAEQRAAEAPPPRPGIVDAPEE